MSYTGAVIVERYREALERIVAECEADPGFAASPDYYEGLRVQADIAQAALDLSTSSGG